MDAKKSKPAAQASRPRSAAVVRFFTPVVCMVLAAGVVLFGVVMMGRLAHDRLIDSERYTIPFRAIECLPAPPGQELEAFLNEVQYLAELPGQVRLRDEGLVRSLAGAFLKHPWVERVERVTRTTQQVRVWLVYRTPVLAVAVEDQVRAVDCHGILLPATADVTGLPLFEGKAKAPAGAAGTLWGDAAVHAAAQARSPTALR